MLKWHRCVHLSTFVAFGEREKVFSEDPTTKTRWEKRNNVHRWWNVVFMGRNGEGIANLPGSMQIFGTGEFVMDGYLLLRKFLHKISSASHVVAHNCHLFLFCNCVCPSDPTVVILILHVPVGKTGNFTLNKFVTIPVTYLTKKFGPPSVSRTKWIYDLRLLWAVWCRILSLSSLFLPFCLPSRARTKRGPLSWPQNDPKRIENCLSSFPCHVRSRAELESGRPQTSFVGFGNISSCWIQTKQEFCFQVWYIQMLDISQMTHSPIIMRFVQPYK